MKQIDKELNYFKDFTLDLFFSLSCLTVFLNFFCLVFSLSQPKAKQRVGCHKHSDCIVVRGWRKRRGVCKKTHTSCPGQELIVLQTTRSWKRIKDFLKWCGAEWKAGEAIAMEMFLMCACVSVSAPGHASMQSSLAGLPLVHTGVNARAHTHTHTHRWYLSHGCM